MCKDVGTCCVCHDLCGLGVMDRVSEHRWKGVARRGMWGAGIGRRSQGI